MAAPLRIMCLSNMYPGPADPDYGAFVATMCDALEARGHRVDRVVIDTRAAGRLRTPAKYLRLAGRALARARSADVIYAHYLFPTGAIAWLAGRARRRPWVLTAHGGDVRNLASRPISAASGPGMRGAATVVAVSRYLAGELRDRARGLPRVVVANMGVDLARFRPGDRAAARARLGIPADAVLVLAVGGLTERKNPLRLAQAVARLRRDDPRVQLAYVGDGPLAGALRADLARLGFGEAAHLPGTLPHDAVADWMVACDLLALPSLVEPLGIVALEAMACGRPVLATRVGGTAEIVGRAGVLVDPASTDAIARGLERLIADPPSEAVCRAAAETHAVARQAARIEQVLAEAVRGD